MLPSKQQVRVQFPEDARDSLLFLSVVRTSLAFGVLLTHLALTCAPESNCFPFDAITRHVHHLFTPDVTHIADGVYATYVAMSSAGGHPHPPSDARLHLRCVLVRQAMFVFSSASSYRSSSRSCSVVPPHQFMIMPAKKSPDDARRSSEWYSRGATWTTI